MTIENPEVPISLSATETLNNHIGILVCLRLTPVILSSFRDSAVFQKLNPLLLNLPVIVAVNHCFFGHLRSVSLATVNS